MDVSSIQNESILWIAWERQRRSTTLARHLGADLRQLESSLPRFERYLLLALSTINLIIKKKPRIIFVQNPSIVLCFLITLYKKVFRTSKLIIDCHTPYIRLKGIPKIIFDHVTRFIFVNADMIIVTNNDLSSLYSNRYPNVVFFVLPDKVPEFPNLRPIRLSAKTNILLVCTFSDDEPYIEAFKAMHKIESATLYVTGNSKRASAEALSLKPENVILTGFLTESDYASFLNAADIIMDLTDIENCLVCGAYEAVSLGKPMILSDKKVLRDYFVKGAVFTRNTAGDIAIKIQTAIKHQDNLRNEVLQLRHTLYKNWTTEWNRLLYMLEMLIQDLPLTEEPSSKSPEDDPLKG
jgi:glycosyltransferase involved in cell wall biosynthesis